MESKKPTNSDSAEPEPKKTFFVQIGFIFSLAFMAFLLELMHLLTVSETYTSIPVFLEMPSTMIKSEELKKNTTPIQQFTPPEIFTSPKISILDEIADKLIVPDKSAIKTEAELKKDSVDNKFKANDSILKAEPDVEDPTPFTIIEEKPSFPGGNDALFNFLGDNLKYPPIAKEAGVVGTVIISFIIEKDGSLSNVKVFHGIGGGCNEEALRVVKMMPKWTPGKQHGKPVRAQVNISFNFFLNPV